MNYSKKTLPESIHQKKIRESWMKLIEKDPILVIDLKTLKLRPANTNEKRLDNLLREDFQQSSR